MEREGKHHSCDNSDNICLKKVCSHTSTITDVISYVISDNGRISWIIFRNSCFDFPDEISSDIRCFRKYTTSKTCKYGNKGSSESESNKRVNSFFKGETVVSSPIIKSCNTEEGETNNEHSRDISSFYCDRESTIDTMTCGLCGADVCTNGNIHANISSKR